MQDYLKWCWQALSTTTANTNIYTIVHVCLAHFMKRVKEHCGKLFKGGTEIILYSFSLMANSLYMLKFKHILFDLVVVVSSDRQAELYMKFFAHINELIKRMSNQHKSITSITSTACDIITNDDSFVPSSASVPETNCDESDLLYLSPV